MEKLNPRTREALKKMGFKALTPIQEQAIATFDKGVDFVARSQTGTGKTAAYLIPIIEKCSGNGNYKAIIIEPSRELVIQASNECRKISDGTQVRCVAAYGGTGTKRQIELISSGAQIIIGTPARIGELVGKGSIKAIEFNIIVLDEADRLLAEQFEKPVFRIVNAMPKERQTMLFGVQLPSPLLKKAASKKLLRENFSEVKVGTVAANTVQHYYIIAQNKSEVLSKQLKRYSLKSIVFCTTLDSLDLLRKDLNYFGVRVIAMHSNLDSDKRHSAIKRFAGQELPEDKTLLATDIAARGIHFEGVKRIYSFELPATPEFYLHRAGRTGRMGNSGECISIVKKEELKSLKK